MTARQKFARAAGGSFELDEQGKDSRRSPFGCDPANHDVFDPAQHQRIPKGGAWGMIVRRLPPLEGGIDRHVRVARVFWLDHHAESDDAGFLPDGRYKVKLDSPWGTLSLWPYEYSRVEPARLVQLWQAEDLVFHPLNLTQAAFDDVVFYARTRGIRLADAAVMALGSLSGPVGWFEPAPDLAVEAEALERELHLPMSVHHERRLAARARRDSA